MNLPPVVGKCSQCGGGKSPDSESLCASCQEMDRLRKRWFSASGWSDGITLLLSFIAAFAVLAAFLVLFEVVSR